MIEIPLPPCQSVDALTYVDDDGATQTSTTTWSMASAARPARLIHAYGARWPATRRQGDAVSVTFTCGYGGWNDVPEFLVAAPHSLHNVKPSTMVARYEDAVNELLMSHRMLVTMWSQFQVSRQIADVLLLASADLPGGVANEGTVPARHPALPPDRVPLDKVMASRRRQGCRLGQLGPCRAEGPPAPRL